jgi:hypothetical protein
VAESQSSSALCQARWLHPGEAWSRPRDLHGNVFSLSSGRSFLLIAWHNLINGGFAPQQCKQIQQWWQQDHFDRYIRDEAHFHKAVHYIENNPAKARLVKEPKAWPFSSARWRQQGFGLQPVQGPS